MKTAASAFFASMELLLLPKASRLGDRLAPYPVAKVGAFIRVEKAIIRTCFLISQCGFEITKVIIDVHSFRNNEVE